MVKYPMLLKYVPRQMIWGGNRLKSKYNKESVYENIGESWELTCRPEARSVVANGLYSGMELCQVLGCGYDFPLLIKFIDAKDKLSVQVHPDDDITDENGNPLGKTEMWYIIDCDEDSYIIYGLEDEITLAEYETNVRAGKFLCGMKKVYVKPGDCYFIPAGQVHAIGKGILLAEIQQNSDTTYRLYDYDRLDNEGNPRELHIDKALSVIKARTDNEITKIQLELGHEENCLANCSKFKCIKYVYDECTLIYFNSDRFISLVFIEGCFTIESEGVSYTANAGDTYYIPEGLEIYIYGKGIFLEASAN